MPSDSGSLDSPIAGAFDSSSFGIAICDDQLRYVGVNSTLATIHGIPEALHVGKTVREVIGKVASTVELMLRSVLFTGESILNAEIMGELPTRNKEGYWVVHYLPICDSTGRVKQVAALVIEITGLRRLENCILGLMANPPRARGQFTHLGTPYGLEKVSTEWLNGSIEMVETSVREALKNYHKLQHPSQKPNWDDVITHQQVRLPYSQPTVTNRASGRTLDPSLVATIPLSTREVEIVRLLASGKSNKEISTALMIAPRTVETYRARIMLKLQLHSISDLVHYAIRLGLVKV